MKKFFIAFVFVSLFVLSSSSASAQRTCCEVANPSSNSQCNACDTSGRYWKSNNGASVSCVPGTQVSGYGCQAAVGNSGALYSAGEWICTGSRPYGNACGGTQVDLCTLFAVTPATVNLTVGQTANVLIQAKEGSYSKIVNVNTAPTVASFYPSIFYANGKTYDPAGYKVEYMSTTVTGLKLGSSYMSFDLWATFPGYEKVYCSLPFTANVVSATPRPTTTPAPTSAPTPTPSSGGACIPGAKCLVSDGSQPSYGKNMNCSMPVVPTSITKGNAVAYEMSCDYVDNDGAIVIPKIVTKTSSNGKFGSYKINYSNGAYRCYYRYCVSGGACSTWGRE